MRRVACHKFGRRRAQMGKGLVSAVHACHEFAPCEKWHADRPLGETICVLGATEYRALAEAGRVPRVLEVAEQGDDARTVVLVEVLCRMLAPVAA